MARRIHVPQPIEILIGNPTELIFALADPPDGGIGAWTTEFLFMTEDRTRIGDPIAGEMNKGEDGAEEEGSIRIVIPSAMTDALEPGSQYWWDHWRIIAGSDPKYLAGGPATLLSNVRFPAPE